MVLHGEVGQVKAHFDPLGDSTIAFEIILDATNGTPT
jgi:hypothetical protein